MQINFKSRDADPRSRQKRAIRAAFDNAASRYDSVAQIQRQIADALLCKCAKTAGMALDAGCGTGYALAQLRALSTSCLSLDHAVAMLKDHTGVCGDIESLPLPSASIALYYSSLAWQWTDATHAIAEAARTLQADGMLAVATLGPNTLQELRQAFRHADTAEHVRQFSPIEFYLPLLAESGFEAITIERRAFTAYSPDFRSTLQQLKTLGANVMDQPRSAGLFGAQGFRRAEAHYECQRETQGLPLTYDAVFITAKRVRSPP